jgi:hypothetical protein
MCGELSAPSEMTAEPVFGLVKILCAGCAEVATGRWEPKFLTVLEAEDGPAMTEEEFAAIASTPGVAT